MNLFDETLIKDNFNDKINILKKNNKVISFFYLLKKKTHVIKQENTPFPNPNEKQLKISKIF